MKKLVCDRCGKQLTDIDAVEIALEGKEAWEASVRACGGQPRGVFPCENFVRCHGEMKLVDSKRVPWWHRGLSKLLGQ
ncbi:hypothetical protein ACFLUU_07415 [Chloroflexota bacterium]